MAKEKNPVPKIQMTDGKRNIIKQLLAEYDIKSAQDIQDALKDLLGGTIKEMMEAEMNEHLGYCKSERSENDDYRNGYKTKQVNSSYGSMRIDVPQDRKSTFSPQIVKKHQKDISDIDQKIISMYAKGMTTRQISSTLEEIYGFETSEGFISDVTDKILPQEVGENESAKYWLSVLNGLKNRGVKDILIICADGLSGIKEAISAAYPETEYQRCIVHQVRNTMKYIPDKDRKPFCNDLKTIYQAPNRRTGLGSIRKS